MVKRKPAGRKGFPIMLAPHTTAYLKRCLREVIASALKEVSESSAAPYSSGQERAEKFASRAWAVLSRGLSSVREHNSVPGALSLFYLHLGCTVHLHDPDEKELKKLAERLKDTWESKVSLNPEPKGKCLHDIDPVGFPLADVLREASAKNAVLAVTDGSLSQRKRFPSNTVPQALVDLGVLEEGAKWKDVDISQEEIWKRVAKVLKGKLDFVAVRWSSAPALYAVLA